MRGLPSRPAACQASSSLARPSRNWSGEPPPMTQPSCAAERRNAAPRGAADDHAAAVRGRPDRLAVPDLLPLAEHAVELPCRGAPNSAPATS